MRCFLSLGFCCAFTQVCNLLTVSIRRIALSLWTKAFSVRDPQVWNSVDSRPRPLICRLFHRFQSYRNTRTVLQWLQTTVNRLSNLGQLAPLIRLLYSYMELYKLVLIDWLTDWVGYSQACTGHCAIVPTNTGAPDPFEFFFLINKQ